MTGVGVQTLDELVSWLGRGITPVYGPEALMPVVNQRCIRDGRVRLGQTKRHDVTRKAVPPRRLLAEGDILVNSTGEGTLGRVGLVKDCGGPITVDSHVTIVRPEPGKVYPQYLGYALLALQQEIMEMAEGSTGQTELPPASLKALEIPMLDDDDQVHAATFLGDMDARVDIHRLQIATLTKLLDALFARFLAQSWLEPLAASPATKRLAPGWRLEPLGKHASVEKGLSYKGDGLCDDGMPLHNLNSILEGGGYKYAGLKRYRGAYRNRHTCSPGDILVANTEQGFDELLITSCALVPRRYGPLGLYTHHVFRVRVSESGGMTSGFIYLALRQREFREAVLAYTNGTTVNGLERAGLEQLQLPIPPPGEAKAFEASVRPLLDRLETYADAADAIHQTRDAMLAPLMAGSLSVGEAVRRLNAAR